MSSPAVQPAWYNRGIHSPQLTEALKTMDDIVRTLIKQHMAPPPNVDYTPVMYEETQAPGPSSTDIMEAPFIGVVIFLKIANSRRGTSGKAGVILKDAKKIVTLTAQGVMIFSAAIFPPNSFEYQFNEDDPTHHVGLVSENLDIQYLVSYWKKIQV
ncbi:hypothetical protein K438DRAFT_1967793 [Mycena galopus ATCC 62051]|nr:hypothetical protein K438DRAFT_1967793 [Mycena galopus ATCC 62051]